jgi:hypothetical protein
LTTPRPQLEVSFPRLHVKFDSHTVQRSVLFWTLLQGLYFDFQQTRGLHRYDAPVSASQYLVSTTVHFKTLAPRAYITYYQTWGLSGHTSPCVEYAYFSTPTLCLPCLHFFSEIQVGTLHQAGNIFRFLKSTIHYSDNLLLRRQRWLVVSQASRRLPTTTWMAF